MSWFITNLIAAFLLPPMSILLAMALGIMLFYRHPKIARALLMASFGLLWLCATPYFSDAMLHLLEAKTAPLNNPPPAADAIVILGGGTYFHAPEYAGQDTVNARALLRLHYGARLFRETHQPLLVTGGKPLGNAISEAQQMRSVLEQDFQVPVRWIEDMSNNTFENARYSFQILQKEGIKKIYLVTHSWHMPRSAEVFRRAGFDVVEAPTAFTTRFKTDLFTFIPDAGALQDSINFFHEMIGLAWYQIKS